MHLRPFTSQDAKHLGERSVRIRRNPLLILPLGVAVIVSAMPHNALAFETQLAEDKNTTFIAPVTISRPSIGIIPNSHLWASVPAAAAPSAIVATASPVTTTGERTKVVVVATPVPVPAPQVAVKPPIAPKVPEGLPEAPGSATLTLEGEASYYSRAGCLGCDPAMIMANGQPLDDSRLTMAIGANLKHLVGRRARVTSLATGKSTMVQITDTGGFYQAKYGHRVADLTVATKQAIGMAGGVGQVRVEVF